MPDVNIAVTALWGLAITETIIGIDLIAVITGFIALHKTITANGELAALGTGAVIVIVCAQVAFLDARLHKAITTRGHLALGAAIGVDRISIVTLLDANLDDAVAARCVNTVIETLIVVILIAIVAGFCSRVQQTVTTTGSPAGK